MLKDLFGDGPWFSSVSWDDLPKIGLLFFFCFFVVMVVWVFRKGGRSHYDTVSRLPLEGQPRAATTQTHPIVSMESKED